MRREPDDRTVVTLVERQWTDQPSATAVALPSGQTSTYAELRDRAAQLAAELRSLDAGQAPCVAIDLPNGLDFCAAVLAVLGGGATMVTVDRAHPPARIAAMLSLAAPGIVVTDRPDGEIAAWLPGGAAVLRPAPAGAAGAAPGWLTAARPGPSAPAYIVFTSGTTGTPKATLNTHAGLLNHLLFMSDVCALPAGSRVLLKSARSFDAWLLEFFWALTQGNTLVLADEARATDARYLAAVLAGQAIHGLIGVPSLLRQVFAVLGRTGDTTSLRIVISAGEALTGALASQILTMTHARLFNFYGPAEAAIDVAYHAVDGPSVTDPVPIGTPLPGNRLLVKDEAGRDITHTGDRGELVVVGCHVGLGYVGDERATTARFASVNGERSYATGDVGYQGPDQHFYVGGRMDTQVKINGVRVEVEEIESCLRRHETVADCLVRVTDSGGVPVLVAFIQVKGEAATKSEYISYLRQQLPPVMVPPAYVFVSEFSYLPSGKKDTSGLEFPRGLPTVTAAGFEPPRGPLEQELATIWESVLGVSPIGALDDFSLVGGDSLKMIDVLVRISQSAFPDIFTLVITKLSTVRGLAERIEQSRKR